MKWRAAVAVALSALVPSLAAAQEPPLHRWQTSIGLSVGSDGPGAAATQAVGGRWSVRAAVRGFFSAPRALGLGLGYDFARSNEGRLTAAVGFGGLDCHCAGDEGGGNPSPTWGAPFVTLGGEFATSGVGRTSVGVEFEQWFPPAADAPHHRLVAFLVRFYL